MHITAQYSNFHLKTSSSLVWKQFWLVNSKPLCSVDIENPPLSGRKIWFNFRHHQRKLCHFTPWIISFNLRYVLKKLVWPKGMNIEAEKGWVVKEWEFWKREKKCYIRFFNWSNFSFMVCDWIPLRSGLKIEFVPFLKHHWFKISPASISRSASKRKNSDFKPFLGRN